MTADTLKVRFVSPEALREEFEKNISNRGVFVETEEAFEVRQTLTVEIHLDYAVAASEGEAIAASHEPALVLDGEVVHVVGAELAASGATPGVAVQFEANATVLRERFEPLLGAEAALRADPSVDCDGEGRRSAKRGAVRVSVLVKPREGAGFETTSRDVSATGILLSVRAAVLPVGSIVRLSIRPAPDVPALEIAGKVTRHVQNKSGRTAAMAVAFDRKRAAEPAFREAVESMREAGHQSRLGGISGSIAEVGLPSLLQMFGASAPRGTLVVENEGEQGWIAFADGRLVTAECGDQEGQDALVAMLDWSDGRFAFEASLDARIEARLESAPGELLEAAILAAVTRLDEGRQGMPAEDAAEVSLSDLEAFGGPPPAVALSPETTFEVDVEQEELSRSALDKTEEAILDLARAGMSVERLRSVIPESPDAVEAALAALVDLGVLLPR